MSRFAKIIVVMIITACSFVYANPNYYVNIGMSKPFAPDDFQNHWRSGFNVGLGLGYNFSPKFEIQGEFLYDNFQLDDIAFLNDITGNNDVYASVAGGGASLYAVYANFKYLSPIERNTSLTPYIVGSLGLAAQQIAEKKVTVEEGPYTIPKESQTSPGVGLGIGVEIVMGGRTSFVVEGRFNILFTDETTVYFPLKLGIVIR
ncbi:outer membrane beta-barrel protein [candidate division KSB1 bacterium]|nr:outer membrane beta-barrel protein [candidate division KSB1 bacterium]